MNLVEVFSKSERAVTDSQKRRLMELFDAALDMTREQQDELLLRVKLDCPRLGARLAALIASDRAPRNTRLHVANIAEWSSTDRTPAEQTRGPSETDIRPGVKVSRYQLIRELGRGGMGQVYLARDTRLGRLAAIKFLHLSHHYLVQRFIAEARATALCNHENIVIIYDADEFQGIPYMALEYLQGQTLRELMRERVVDAVEADPRCSAALSAERTMSIAIPMLRALERAHEMGIIHRDLKPENVMFTDAGTVKILDFGIAKLLDGYALASPSPLAMEHNDSDHDGDTDGDHDGDTGTEMCAFALGQTELNLPITHTGNLVGTLPYMSPEQLLGRPVDARTDVWAVGVMLFEMLTGQHPLAPISRAQLYDVPDMSKTMPRLSRLRPDLGALAQVIDRCLVKPLAKRVATAGELLTALEQFGEPHRKTIVDDDRSPFNGLSAFQEADAGLFFGRSEDTAAIVARVRSHPMVTVIGPSGVGKSSLVRAGVIPALKRSGEGWQSFIARPGRAPLLALAEIADRLNTAGSVGDTVTHVGREAVSERLRAEPGYLGTVLRTHAQRKPCRVLLFVDQFEEVYTLCADDQERAAFLACLAGVADDAGSPLRVVLSMRADFLERLAENRSFMALATRELTLLPPMDRSGLLAALEKPLAAAGHRFESGDTVRDMLDGLEGTRGALPLLQFAATTLWKERDRQRRLLTEDSYRAMGGIAGTLAGHADSVVAAMTESRRKLARAVFERLVTPERTRAVVSVDELRAIGGVDGEAVLAVLDELARARLLVMDTGTVEIVHESLLDRWPMLRRWLDENQEDAAFLARLRTAAREWESSGEAEGMLWSGEPATEAGRWRDSYVGELSRPEQRFLDAVFALSQRVRVRRWRLLYAGVAAVVLLAMAGGYAVIKGLNEAALAHSLAKEQEARSEAAKAKERALQRAAEALTAQQAEAAAKAKEAERAEAARAAEAEARAAADELKAVNDRIVDVLARAQWQRKRASVAAVKARRAQQDAEDAREEAERAREKLARVNQLIEELIARQGIEEVKLPGEKDIVEGQEHAETKADLTEEGRL